MLPPYRDREHGILPPLAVPPSPGQSPLTFPGRAGRGRAMSAALDISGFRPEPGKASGWLPDVTGYATSWFTMSRMLITARDRDCVLARAEMTRAQLVFRLTFQRALCRWA